MLTADAVNALRARLRGSVITPDDPPYDAARSLHNAMIDKRPAAIAQCRDVADVITAVQFGREQDVAVAVRCGGHNGAGLGSVDNGLVIDLSPMRGTRVDPVARTVVVQGGCTLGDMDHATQAFGLATPTGINSTTGVGGLTLGGGIGNLTRPFGLTIDNLLEVDVVLADGRFVTANAEAHPDLFWALRGGGGNFGVVTSFKFRLHPVSTVYGGPMFWDLDESPEVLRWWNEFILEAPDHIGGYFGFHTVPPADLFPQEHHLKLVGMIMWCITGDLAEAEAAVQPVRRFRKPLIDYTGPMPYMALQTIFDPLFVPGFQWYWNADFFTELSPAAMDLHFEHFAQTPTVLSGVHLYSVNGAAHRASRTDTAWNYRDANFAQVVVGVDGDPANKELITRWSTRYWQALHPHSAGGAYVNMMMEEGQERVQAAYRENYPRLAAIKAQYDPTNFFRINQNIRPAG